MRMLVLIFCLLSFSSFDDRAIPVIGNTVIEGLDTVSLPRRPPISLSLLNLLENSEGSRRSTEVLSESSSIDRLHSRQASLDTMQSPPLPQHDVLEALYAKVCVTGLK